MNATWKPHTKKPRGQQQVARVRERGADRGTRGDVLVLVARDLAAAAGQRDGRAAARGRRTPDSRRSARHRAVAVDEAPGRAARTGTARASRAAVARPIDHDRRSSGTSRAKAASTIVNEPPARPRPSSTPPVSASAPALVLSAISAVPSAYSSAAARPAPGRRRSGPRPRPRTAGRAPRTRFCSADREARTSRDPTPARRTAAP